jgi:hypothetical protein
MTTSRSSGTRQKITVIVFIAVLAIVGWQVYSLFEESIPTPPASPTAAANNPTAAPSLKAAAATSPPGITPPAAAAPVLPKPPVLSAKELELIKLQRQAEERYVAAVSQLQMLKIEREIAETNKSIAAARLATATAEKDMAKLAQPLGNFSQNLTTNPTSGPSQPEISNLVAAGNFMVISVAYLQGRWSAVLSNQGKLYQIFVGDILPDNNNVKVLEINKSGVTLKIGDETRKISLVPLI